MKIDKKKFETFIKEKRNDLILLKEYVNTDNHYKNQSMEAYHLVDNLMSEFQGLYSKLCEELIPEIFCEDKEESKSEDE